MFICLKQHSLWSCNGKQKFERSLLERTRFTILSETTAIKQRKKKKKKKAFLHKINKKKIVFFELDAGNIAFFFLE